MVLSKRDCIGFALACLVVAISAGADVRLPDVFADHMVLQQGRPVPVWGQGHPGEAVVVQFQQQKHQATADRDGKWRVELAPLAASATPATLTIRGRNVIELKDVLVGEAWFCSGQSNMQWPLVNTADGDAAVASADHPHLRLFSVNRRTAFGQEQGPLGKWQPCTPESARGFSAVAYYFGVALQRELDVPIGLINDSFGGTPAEGWTPREALESHADLRPILERNRTWESERPRVRAEHDTAMKQWKADVAKAKEAGEKPPREPRLPNELRPEWVGGAIWEKMVEPVVPFAIRGVTWYQGESNEDRAEQYAILLPTMIRAWRQRWGQGEFPFLIVQLPGFRQPTAEPSDSAWSHLRDAQLEAHKVTPNTGLIVTIDVGERNDIHPQQKQPVGERLARWALADVYGRQITKSGPIFKSANVEGDKIVVRFDEAGQGLRIRGDSEKLGEFAIAGEDQQFHWADAKIVGKDRVEVSAAKVLQPRAVRYAWNSWPRNPNLTNDSDVPASPFRTDDWPGPTDGKR